MEHDDLTNLADMLEALTMRIDELQSMPPGGPGAERDEASLLAEVAKLRDERDQLLQELQRARDNLNNTFLRVREYYDERRRKRELSGGIEQQQQQQQQQEQQQQEQDEGKRRKAMDIDDQ
jgi:ABC-type transporter lipoprotein component MlaA